MRRSILPFVVVAATVLAAGILRAVSATPVVHADEPGAWGFVPGEQVADFAWKSVDGRRGRLADMLSDYEVVVVVLRTVGCPVSQKYGHRLARMEQEYGERGVGFLYLNVGPHETPESIADEIATFGFEAPYVSDPDARIGGILQVSVSTEVFVIDRARTLRYRGAVDDQYGITFAKPEPREAYLRDALDALLAGRPIETRQTEASGCFIDLPGDALVPARSITWHGRVSRIVQENCQACHRTGGVAPFPLQTYADAYGFRGMIRHVVEERRMPPWFADPAHGEWKNDRTLSDRDRRDLLAWIDAGAPEGDARHAPLNRAWVDGWQLDEEPHAVIRIPEPIPVPAEGVVDYQYVYVQTDFDDERWITKVEPRPSAAQVTHHIIVFLVDGPDDEGGRFLAGTAPGVPATVYPEGSGKRLPKGAWLKFELHYTPNGRAAEDQSMVGFVFADERPAMEVETSAVATRRFEIPPGEPAHEVVANLEFDRPGELIAFLPHMHLRGKAFRYELIRPDGTSEVLLDVPRYDFNWQLWYQAARPIRVEPGTVLRGHAVYDNSAGNPANPDPGVTVRYGEQSFEEMMFGFFDWIPDPAAKRIATN